MSNSPGNFWDLQGYQEKKWFGTVAVWLTVLISVYIILHFFNFNYGYEYAKLDDKQIQQINKIYFNDSVNINRSKDEQQKDISKPKLGQTSVDSPKVKTDSPKVLKDDKVRVASSQPKKDSCKCDTLPKCERVLEYLNSEFVIDQLQIDSFKQYLCFAGPLEATGFLANLKLRVKSYFWLKGSFSYFEIIFWTLFGVLSNILFSLGVVSRKSTNNPNDPTTYFDSSEIPSQVAKLFYSPLCTLIIVFGYNYFTGQSLADISSSKGVIVFAFVGGFYSERLIAFLDRLKDVLLPNSGKADVPQTKQASLRNAVIQLTKPLVDAGAVDIFSTLDLSTAAVTLTYQLTGETITAKNIDKSQPTLFIADFIKPGMYKIDTTLNGKDPAGNTLLLTGSQNAEMKTVDLFVIVQLNKA